MGQEDRLPNYYKMPMTLKAIRRFEMARRIVHSKEEADGIVRKLADLGFISTVEGYANAEFEITASTVAWEAYAKI